jgi:hypothetical protein
MRTCCLVLALAACGGSADAPRPIAPSTIEEPSSESPLMVSDDDGDGLPNPDDGCPLASAPHGDSDGCPDGPAPDAGASSIPP